MMSHPTPIQADPISFGMRAARFAISELGLKITRLRRFRYCKGLRLAPPTISVGTRRLVKAGWLERRQDPQDRRGKPLFLTPEGEGIINHVRQHRYQMLKLFLSGLTPDEQGQFVNLLEKAVTAMEASLENDN